MTTNEIIQMWNKSLEENYNFRHADCCKFCKNVNHLHDKTDLPDYMREKYIFCKEHGGYVSPNRICDMFSNQD